MTAILLFCLCQAANAPASGVPAERMVLNTVSKALQADPDLANQHRGYLTFLDSHPEIAAAENAYTDLSTLSAFRGVAQDFDEALQRDATFEGAFDRYYESLAANAAVRHSVDALQRLEQEHKELRDGGAMDYLRGHVDEAVRFLEKPAQVAPTPPALYPLLAFFKHKPEIRKELLSHFRSLSEQAAAHAAVLPWWEEAGAPTESQAARQRFMEYFSGRAHPYWIWHNRAVELAKQPHIRDWVRYWQRRVRRNKDLAENYAEYLKLIRERPELRRAAFNQWEKELGPVPPWPPEGPPPPLPLLLREQTVKSRAPSKHQIKQDLMPKAVKRPEKPSVHMPEMPQRPEKPVMPKKSSKKPEP